LPRSDFRFHLWCSSPRLAAAARDLGAMAETYPDPSATERGHLLPPADLRRRAAEVVRRVRPDVIHCNAATVVKWMLPSAVRHRVPMLYHEHNETTRGARLWGWLHQAHLVVGVSEAAISGYLDDGLAASRVRVIYNGIEAARLDRRDLRWPDAARSRDGLVRVATLGSLIPRKGVDALLHGFATARAAEPRLRLRIGGMGPSHDELRALCTALGLDEAVEWCGEVHDLAGFFAGGADVFVSMSRSETLNRTLTEAGYCGVPVVATDLAAHREALCGRDGGWLVPVDDAAALALALRAHVTAPEEQARRGLLLQSRVRHRFDMHRFVSEFAAAYEDLLRQDRARYGLRGLRAPSAVRRWVLDALRARLLGRRRATAAPGRTLRQATGATGRG
ncbi:MAG TPA: glycosyltransferase family 4 protein, partial [Gemmatimonadales bacterium]|nr:glycosyltransferase family 4 protein [Gemmatimonadales bacterium]